jgi:hypothetical protein
LTEKGIEAVTKYANIRFMGKNFMIGRPFSSSAHECYGIQKPLSQEGQNAAILHLALQEISKDHLSSGRTQGEYHEVMIFSGDKEQIPCITYIAFKNLYSGESLALGQKAVWDILGENWPDVIGRNLNSSRRTGPQCTLEI